MPDCIFCKIISWEIPCVKIWEDENFIATLDIFPNTKWMTLLIPKKHYESDLFNIEDEFYVKYFLTAKKIVQLLKKWLWVSRIAMVMEWMWVNHAHIKFYPLYWLESGWEKHLAKEEIYFDQYEWYISTQLWPKADLKELQKIAEEIKLGTGN